MIIPLTLLSLASPDLGAATTVLPVAQSAVAVGPQGPEVTPMPFPAPTRPPSGGTPEPGTVLLLAGAAAAYGLYRVRRNKVVVAAPRG